jgi:type II secretory pathway component PulM
VQWSQLQNLIKQAKSAASSGQSSYSAISNVPSTVGQLDELELQKIRNILTARGLKPNLLRLTTDNPPRIELQASDVMFSVLLDALDELRVTWRLYPQELKVIAGSGAGMVNVSGNLQQQGSQLGASR